MATPSHTHPKSSDLVHQRERSSSPPITGKRVPRRISGTSVPARASALPEQSRPRSRYTRQLAPPSTPTQKHVRRSTPPPQRHALHSKRLERFAQEYSSHPEYAASSEHSPERMTRVAPLAPAIDQLATRPPQPPSHREETPEPAMPDPADLDTIPPARDEEDTPSPYQHEELEDEPTHPIPPTPQQCSPVADIPTTPMLLSSMQELSPAQEEMAQHDTQAFYQRLLSSNTPSHPLMPPLEGLRGWLLRPGRLEFLFWLGGALLLLGTTSILLFAFALNLGISHADQPAMNTPTTRPATCENNGKAGHARQQQNCTALTITAPTGLQATILNGDLLTAGTSLTLQGQGFSPKGQVYLTHDGTQPCLPATVTTDQQGTFTTTLDLSNTSDWAAGSHEITLLDATSGQGLSLTIVLASPQPATPTPEVPISSSSDTIAPSTNTDTSDQFIEPPTSQQTPVPSIAPTPDTPTPIIPTPQPTVSTATSSPIAAPTSRPTPPAANSTPNTTPVSSTSP